jgi:hypothetical protein
MIVFWQENLVLLAVPKTGTSAIAQKLAPIADMSIQNPPELKHAPVYRYNRFLRPMFKMAGKEDMTLAAVIRNPIDWLGSWYRYRQRPFLDGHPNSTKEITFDEFVQAYMKAQPPQFARVGSQAKFLARQENGVGVDALFQYEQISKYIAFIGDRLEIKIDLERVNASPDKSLTLSPETEAKLRRKFEEDFELWTSAYRP